jgi:hypothetical protein
MDLCLYAMNNAVAAEDVARATGLTAAQVQLVWRDITAKRRATATCTPIAGGSDLRTRRRGMTRP